MNKQTARELLMDYLYDEISKTDRERLENYMETHPEFRREVDELRATRSLLSKAPDVEMNEKIVVMNPQQRSFSEWCSQAANLMPRSIWGKVTLSAAACLVFLFVIASIINLSIQSTQNGFSVHLGYGNQPTEAALSAKQVNVITKKIHQQDVKTMAAYAAKLNRSNQQQLQQAEEHFEKKRIKDLELFKQALDQYQQKTNYQLLQTHRVMGQIVESVAANYKQNNK